MLINAVIITYSSVKFALCYPRQLHLMEEVEWWLRMQTSKLPVLDTLSL